MGQAEFQALKQRWDAPIITEAPSRAPDPAEAANFGAFMGAFQQTKQATGR